MKATWEAYGRTYSVQCEADDISAEDAVDNILGLLVFSGFTALNIADAARDWADEVDREHGREADTFEA